MHNLAALAVAVLGLLDGDVYRAAAVEVPPHAD